MTNRFDNMRKIPAQPALRLLALANLPLGVEVSAPAAAPADAVLRELEAAGAVVDMMKLLAAALPVRECIWWGCLAAEDTVPDGAPPPDTLARARDWVMRPGDDTREKARAAAERAPVSDDTVLCAQAVALSDGKLGPGGLAAFEAPAGAHAAMMFGMNMISLATAEAEAFRDHAALLIDRAVDIARGGSGRTGEAGRGAPE